MLTLELLCEPVERHAYTAGLSEVDFKALVKAYTQIDAAKGTFSKLVN